MRKPMSAAQKKAFVTRMKRGKQMAARKRKSPATKRRTTTTRRRNPTRKIATRPRRRTTRRKTVARRRRNPAMKVAGIKVKPVVIQSLGVAGGAYIGSAVTDAVDRWVVSRLPENLQALGFALGGIGTVIFGEYLQKKVKGDIPVVSAAVATSVPMWLKAFELIGVMPAGYKTPSTTAGMGLWPFKRKMRGSLQPGRVPGGMAGTIQPGNIPGAMIGRSGSFGGVLN